MKGIAGGNRSNSQEYSKFPAPLGGKKLIKDRRQRDEPIDEDDEGKRVSIVSGKNKNIEKQYSTSKSNDDLGFFDKILRKFGCLTRENKETAGSRNS